MKKILQLGNKVLTTPSVLADINSKETKTIISELLETVETVKDHSGGLSAPQIGYNKRIALCRRMDLEEEEKKSKIVWEVMVNPVITKKSKTVTTFWEGCLSVSNGGLFAEVPRASEITVKFFDKDGKEKVLEAKGYFSHVVQHEVDHLDGILFLKYVPDPSELYTAEELERED